VGITVPSKAITGLLALCLTASMHARHTVEAQAPEPPPPPRRPLARGSATSWTYRAPDARGLGFVMPTMASLSFAIDSASTTALHVQADLWRDSRGFAHSTAVIPVVAGARGLPIATLAPLRELDPFDRRRRSAGILPRGYQERLALHETMRLLIEFGAAFDAAPAGGAERRTVRYADGDGDSRIRIEATRVSRALRDTFIDGQRTQVVRDSTVIVLDRAYLVPSQATRLVQRVRESARGVGVGIRLVDAESQLSFSSDDTLVMRGSIDLDDGAGGTVRGPLFMRSIHRTTLEDAGRERARMMKEQLESVSTRGTRGLESEQLAPAMRDSLLQLLGTAPRRSTRDSIRGRVSFSSDEAMWRGLWERSLVSGDTGVAIRYATEFGGHNRTALTTDQYRVIRRSLLDARNAFRFGVDREALTLRLIGSLLERPPVLNEGLWAFSSLLCTPEACRDIAADAANGSNPFLHAVGLIAAMTTLPRVWSDSVIKYSRTNPFISQAAVALARGASSDDVNSEHWPIPAPDAPYYEWILWLQAREAETTREQSADTAVRRSIADAIALQDTAFRWNVRMEAARAIRFAEARTGQRFADAFRRTREKSSSDVVRALFSELLVAMNERAYTDAEQVRIVLGADGRERDAILKPLDDWRTPRPPVSDSLARVIGRHIVNMMLADSTLTVRKGTRFGGRSSVRDSKDTLPLRLSLELLPQSVRDRAAELGVPPTASGEAGSQKGRFVWMELSHRGPFILVTIGGSSTYERSSGGIGHVSSALTLLLADGPDGWIVVNTGGWIT
jgi:hypothetical protein